MSKEYEFEETIVTLTDEDGKDRDFYIGEIYKVVENVEEYYVFRLKDLGEDDFELEDIDDEEEYDAAADAYEECLDTRAWNMTFEEENED